MGPIQGYLATAGIGSLIGAVIAWIIFEEAAKPAPSCSLGSTETCLQVLGMGFQPFLLALAAMGGAIGLLVQLVRGDFF